MARKEYSKKLSKKNVITTPFQDAGNIEYLNEKNNTALFCFASDTKKKAMNLVLGSLYDNKILDMFEFEVTNFIPLTYFKKEIEIDSCMKPVIIFQGDIFETDFEYDRIRKFFLDFFRLHDVEEVNVSDLRRVLIVSAGDDKEIKLRMFQVEAFNEYNVRFSLIY